MSVHARRDSPIDEGRWICVYLGDDGKRHEKSFGRGPDAEAEARAYDLAMKSRQAARIDPLQVDAYCAAGGMTFGMLLDEFTNILKSNGRCEKHITCFTQAVEKHFCSAIGRNRPLTEIEYVRDILPILTFLTTEKLKNGVRSAKTVNRYMGYLNGLFNYAVDREYLVKNPMRLWRKAKEHRRIIRLDEPGLMKLIENANPLLAWALYVCFNLGCRPGESELFALKWSDVDFEKKSIHIYGRKTNRHRYVPINDDFCAILREKKAVGVSEFIIERDGQQVKSLSYQFDRARKKAGLPYPVRMYDIRHLFATTLIDKGAPLAAVSKMLGHSRVSTTTDIYYECRQEEMARAVAMLPVLPFTPASAQAPTSV